MGISLGGQTKVFFKEIGSVDSVYIYGYSNISRNAYHILKNVYGSKIKGIVASRFPNLLDSKVDYVFKADCVDMRSSMVVVATNRFFWNEITECIEKSCKSLFYYTEEIDDVLKKKAEEIPLIETRFLNICVGQACNYKCKNCANFAPYAKRENLRYPVENIIGDIDILLRYFSRIDTFHIQGGEPFLYTDLYELLSYVSEKYKGIIGKIQIATNGEILPDERLLKLLASGGYEVRISAYKRAVNSGQLIHELESRRIPYKIYEFVGRSGLWNDSGDINYVVPEGHDMVEKTHRCRWCTCFTVENHLVGRCARSIPALTVQRIEKKDSDYIDIDEDISIDKVRTFFMFIKPIEACRHCKGSGGETIEAAIQL